MTALFQHLVIGAGILILAGILFGVLYTVARLIGRAFALSWFEVRERSEEESFDKLLQEGDDDGEKERQEGGKKQYEGSSSQTG